MNHSIAVSERVAVAPVPVVEPMGGVDIGAGAKSPWDPALPESVLRTHMKLCDIRDRVVEPCGRAAEPGLEDVREDVQSFVQATEGLRVAHADGLGRKGPAQ